jgi:RNA polymerase sigma factor (sigma-70 family)
VSSDAQLCRASVRGDRDAFGRIVERYQSLICAVAYSRTGDLTLSEDMAQETFLTAWRKLGTLQDETKLKPWLCSIVRNLSGLAVRHRKRDAAALAAPLPDAARLPSKESTPPDRALTKEQESVLWQALEEIPETYREPLILYHREGQSVGKVAALLDLSQDAVKQRLSRGRRMLKGQMTSFVEGALAKTGPDRTFGVAVLAALTASKAGKASVAAGGLAGLAKVAAMVAGAVAVGLLVAAALVIIAGKQPPPAQVAARAVPGPAAPEAGPPPEPAPSGTPAFGPLVERVVNDLTTFNDTALDLDTGRLLSPTRNDFRDPQASAAWAEENGVDLFCMATAPGSVALVIGTNIVLAPYARDSFHTVGMDRLLRDPSLIWGQPAMPVFFGHPDHLPAVYAFKTRAGGVGLLQVDVVDQGVPPEPPQVRQVKITYRLVQNWSAPPPDPQAAKKEPEHLLHGSVMGPMRECIIRDHDEGAGQVSMLDLDTGTLHGPTPDTGFPWQEDVALPMKDAADVIARVREKGIDLICDAAHPQNALIGIDIAVCPFVERDWFFLPPDRIRDGLEPRDFARQMCPPLCRPGFPVPISIEAGLPLAFMIMTRGGNLGVLQIVEQTQEPRGLRLRYRMAQPDPTLDILSAIRQDDSLRVRQLLDEGADVNTRGLGEQTLLHRALLFSEGDVELVRFLLDRGADVKAVDSQGRTPLHFAPSFMGYPNQRVGMVELLLAHGADLKALDNAGKSAAPWVEQLGTRPEMKARIDALLRKHGVEPTPGPQPAPGEGR